MGLRELNLENVRIVERAELVLDPRLNLLVGDNGSGKTSLLEAIYLLGRGHSFRTRRVEPLIRHGAERLRVTGRTVAGFAASAPQGGAHRLGLECVRGGGVRARVDGRPAVSLAELSELFPVQVIDPGIHRLLEEGPVLRRRWLDWVVFHVEPAFLGRWRDYRRALQQHNAALRSGADAAVWEPALAELGEQLSASRERVITAFQGEWAAVLEQLGLPATSLAYSAGWRDNSSLAAALAAHRAQDQALGRTSVGAHRFDVTVRCQARPAREVVSRGQQKLLGAALVLCAAAYLNRAVGLRPALLIDDPAAELDQRGCAALLRVIGTLGAQQLVTALRRSSVPTIEPNQLFHVERGGVQTL